MALIPRPSALNQIRHGTRQISAIDEIKKPLSTKPITQAVSATGNDRAGKLAWIGKAATWLPMKAIPAAGKGIGEAATDFYSLLQIIENPEAGIDPLRPVPRALMGSQIPQKPRSSFGAALMGKQLSSMLKADFDHFWDTDKLETVREVMAARRAYGENSPAFQQASRKLSRQNKAFAQKSLSMSVMGDYMSRYGSWEQFADTLYNRPDKIFVDLADFGAFKALGISKILAKATPNNLKMIVEQTEDALRRQADDYLQDNHIELMNRYMDNSSPRQYRFKPKTLYHGSPELETILEEGRFSKERLGEQTGAASAKEGFFFTDNKTVAQSYGVPSEIEEAAHNEWLIDDLHDQKAEIGDLDDINKEAENLETDIQDSRSLVFNLKSEKREIIEKLRDLQRQHNVTGKDWEEVEKALYEATEYDEALENEVSDLFEFWGDIDEEIAAYDDEIADWQDQLDEANENLRQLERIDEQIDEAQGEQEWAVSEFHNLDTAEVHLIMQNPMIFEQQFYNRSLVNTIREAKAAGHDGVIIKNIYDPMHTIDSQADYKGTHYIVFEPAQIVDANTGLQMGDATDLVGIMNLASGRQLKIPLWTPANVDLPAHVHDAIEKSQANSHLSSFYAAAMLGTPSKKVNGELMTPNDVARTLLDVAPTGPMVPNTLTMSANDRLIYQLVNVRERFPAEVDALLEQYQGMLPQEFADRIQNLPKK